MESGKTPGQTTDSTVSLLERKERHSVDITECPKAQRRQVEDIDSGTVVAYWADCGARTCGYCKPTIDHRDAARIAYSLRSAEHLYLAQVPRAHWQRIRNAAHYQGEVAIKMPSRDGHDLVEVVSSAPLSPSSRVASMAEIVELVERRPPGSPPPDKGHRPGRANFRTTGVGLVSVKEFEELDQEKVEKPKARTFEMHHSITPEDVEVLAKALRIPHYRESRLSVRLEAPWDDKRMEILRELTQDPTGELEWERMLWDIEVARGERAAHEPPLESYVEAA